DPVRRPPPLRPRRRAPGDRRPACFLPAPRPAQGRNLAGADPPQARGLRRPCQLARPPARD
ncbi:MAG: hypothetical protein AVDCRST_MAG90-2976, partial [uncultured Microvirga sp.]